MYEIEYEFLTIKGDDWLGQTETISSKAELRDELEKQVEAFLARGGQIKEIPPGVSTMEPQFMIGSNKESTYQSALRGAKAAKHFTARARG